MTQQARILTILFLLDEVERFGKIVAIDIGTDAWRMCEQLVKEELLVCEGETTSGYVYRVNI